MEAYCCRCKCKREMNEVLLTKSKRGVSMAKGLCSICNCKMCKIGVKSEIK